MQNPKVTIDEVFPILECLEDVPDEVCKAAYDLLDSTSPGSQMDDLNANVARCGSTRNIIEHLFPTMEVERFSRKWFEIFALTVEYARRRAHQERPR
jgi:hypothetical protein